MQMMQRWFGRGLILSIAVVCALSVPITAAQAGLVTYSFTGHLDGDTTGSLLVSGLFKYDNTTVGNAGVYNGTVKDYSFKMSFNGNDLYTSSFKAGSNAVAIYKNTSLHVGTGDRWELNTGASGVTLMDGTSPSNFRLQFDQIGGGLNLNAQGPPSLDSLNGGSARWRLLFEDVNGVPGAYVGSISSLTAVPLPTAVLLFGAGLISLVGLGAGGLRNLHASKI